MIELDYDDISKLGRKQELATGIKDDRGLPIWLRLANKNVRAEVSDSKGEQQESIIFTEY